MIELLINEWSWVSATLGMAAGLVGTIATTSWAASKFHSQISELATKFSAELTEGISGVRQELSEDLGSVKESLGQLQGSMAGIAQSLGDVVKRAIDNQTDMARVVTKTEIHATEIGALSESHNALARRVERLESAA